jgi:hypothetical protein
MASPAKTKPKQSAQWVIDTRGVIEALTTSKNSVRAAIIDAIQNGSMLILKPASHELKEAFPDIYEQFQDIKPKKYLSLTVPMLAAAAALTEAYGPGRLLGSFPSSAHFEAVAATRLVSCTLVTSGKSLTHCSAIAKKCGLPATSVQTLSTV